MKIQPTRLLDRNVQHRDAWICIIASEGACTEPQYFQGLQDRGVIDRSRVKIECVPTPRETGDSAPQHVLARLVEIAGRYTFRDGLDQLWLLIDTDRWKEKLLSEVAQACHSRRYRLAVSNPCFELWLVLHFSDAPAEITCCDDCEAALRRHLGSYNKANLDLAPYTRQRIQEATVRAQALETPETGRWPSSLGTRVHHLMAQLPYRDG